MQWVSKLVSIDVSCFWHSSYRTYSHEIVRGLAESVMNITFSLFVFHGLIILDLRSNTMFIWTAVSDSEKQMTDRLEATLISFSA